MRKIALLLVVALLGAGCEEPIHAPLNGMDSELIVVEGAITSENTNHRVRLSRPYKTQNEITEGLSGALLTITEGNTSYSLTESPAGSGNYFTPPFRAIAGNTYTLTILYQGKTYLAQDSAPPVEPMPPLAYNKSSDLYVLSLSPAGDEPNFIRHDISWDGTPACQAGADCQGLVVFYDLKTVDVNEIFKPGKVEFGFPLGSVVIRTKYSISPGYQTFLRAMLSETEWRGGVFDVQRADVPTNLTSGAIGFFAVSTVVTDTTTITD